MISLLLASAIVASEPNLQDDTFYGVTSEEVTCIVVLNYFQNKTKAFEVGKVLDKKMTSNNLLALFDETGFVSISDFAMKMTLDEARAIVYASGVVGENELRKVETLCEDHFLK